MRRLSDTLTRLAARERGATTPPVDGDRLESLTGWGRNPGALAARCFVPAHLPQGASLVVALHGCTQTAGGYDRGTGWSQLAEREGFALLFPEQTRANNPNLCFNWFQSGDIGRTGGEVESIAAMIAALVDQHGLDPARVYVTGLSAGGAMAGAMLAAYPELFAAGAIIGGLPYACATGVAEAFDRMRGHGGADDAALAAAVRAASAGHRGRWPAVSVWHGTADATVSVANMDAIGRQWRGVHGVSGDPAIEHGKGWTHRSWRDDDGRVAVEDWSIAGMGHGVPIDAAGPAALGQSGPFMLDVGLSSTALIAASWGLAEYPAVQVDSDGLRQDVPDAPVGTAVATRGRAASAPAPAAPQASGVQRVIEEALRSAGLMR